MNYNKLEGQVWRLARYELTLECKSNLFVDRDSPDYAYNGQNTLPTGGYMDNPRPNGEDAAFCSYYNFDLSVIPYRKKIVSATLHVYNENSTGTERCDIQAGRFFPNTKPQEGKTAYKDVAPDFRLSDRDSIVSMTMAYEKWYQFPSTTPVASAYELGERSWFWMGLFPYQCGSVAVFHARNHSSGKRPYLTVTYEDVPPNKPDQLHPNGQYVSKDKPVRLSWNYSANVYSTQKSFKLQYSLDNGATWTLIEKTTSQTYYDLGVASLPSGNIMWRVQVFNEYDEASPMSDTAIFYLVGLPSSPTGIAVTNNPKPLISWTAFGQEIYQVQILKGNEIIHDSGYVADALNTSYQYPGFLDDGSYNVKIRIGNQYSLFSDWGETDFMITTLKPPKPTFYLTNDNLGAILDISHQAEYVLVYRASYDSDDYTCVCKGNKAMVGDYTIPNKGTYKYFVRSVKNDNSFSDSATKTTRVNFLGNTLAVADNAEDLIHLKYTYDGEDERPIQYAIKTSEVFFDGRVYPNFEMGEFNNYSQSIECYLDSIKDLNKLHYLINQRKTMIFRENNGRIIYGVITGYNSAKKPFGYTATFTISKNDYKEGIDC